MSDIHFMMNDWAVPPMSTFGTRCAGHEGAGVVAKVGSNVEGWTVGERAGLKPIYDVCHQCEMCFNGMENYCPKGIHTGLAANGKALLFEQQYLYLDHLGRAKPRQGHISNTLCLQLGTPSAYLRASAILYAI